MDYSLIDKVDTGDAVFFVRRTARAIRSWGDLFGYISNAVICAAQWTAGDSDDPGIECIHCGMVWKRHETGNAWLLEYTASGEPGLHCSDLMMRLEEYKPGAFVVPLKDGITADEYDVFTYYQQHRKFGYNWVGLLSACSRIWPGFRVAGSRFCSEGLIEMWQASGVLPRSQMNPQGRRLIPMEIEPHKYSPADVAALRRVLDWEHAWEI